MTCLETKVVYSVYGHCIYGAVVAAGYFSQVQVTAAGSLMTCLVPTIVYRLRKLSMYGGVVAAGKFNEVQVTAARIFMTRLGLTIVYSLQGLLIYGGVNAAGKFIESQVNSRQFNSMLGSTFLVQSCCGLARGRVGEGSAVVQRLFGLISDVFRPTA